VVLPFTVYGQVSPNQRTPILVIDHVAVIDSAESRPKSDVSVVIVGDKIESIRPYSSVWRQAGDVVVDGTGKFLIAGLCDMHVRSLSKNQPDRFFPLFVANGVTGIRDMGGDLSLREIARLKRETRTGARIGPEIYAAGPILEEGASVLAVLTFS